MKHDAVTGKTEATLEEISLYNMLVAEALFELLTERGILTGEEVLERIKKLKSETKVHAPWLQ